MKMISSLKAALFTICLFAGLSTSAQAEYTCNIDFAYGIAVNNEQLRVMDKTRTVVQVNDQNQLFVGGRWQTLNEQERQWLEEYSSGLHYVVPKMIILATEGVDLAIDTIEHVYLGLVGSDHDSYERLNAAMKRVQNRVKDKFRHASNHYCINTGSGEVNQEKVAEITRQLNNVGEHLDVGDKATTLRKKAEWFCEKLKRLDVAEENLRASVPAFKPYNIITRHDKSEN